MVAAARPEEVAQIADAIPRTPRPAAGDRRPIAFLPSDDAAYVTAAHLAATTDSWPSRLP
jgi:hypothetical protein